jgi:hypothetical protein
MTDTTCYILTSDGELYHHGIKGMKWGVRRFQDTKGRLTAAGKQRVKDREINKKIESYVKSGKAKVDNLAHYEVGELSTMITAKGKKYVSGLINGHDFDWQEVNDYGNRGLFRKGGLQNVATILGEDPKRNHRITNPDSIAAHSRFELTDSDLLSTNPGYGRPGTTQNCAKCSSALELRLRGFGINAGRQTYPSSVDAQSLWFKGAKRVDYDYDTAEEALKSYGPNTSGTLSFSNKNNMGGHCVHWTVNSSGAFEIQDGQTAKRYRSLSDLMTDCGGDTTKVISTHRLDNCEPNYDMLAQDSVLRFADGNDAVRNKFSNQIVSTW